ncbi:insulinase family protein, partial [Alistipes sp. OttesenSCG-928-B03]|nr:insulinase family protein [Alistipes sp. OttesenSCG-928-B03]
MKSFFVSFLTLILAVTSVVAQQTGDVPRIPADPEVRVGKLENGMTYYIRHNSKPEGLADFWIYHDVGAIQEEDSQTGLAHFLEHMAFNGTKNMPGKEMINWLETIGVKFGTNLNAMTG